MTEPTEPEETGVLDSLPHTRPQHRSPKRDAAPGAARAKAPSSSPARKVPKPGAAAKPRVAAKPSAAARAPAEPASANRAAAEHPPMAAQGYEADTVRGAVEPPSRTDIVGAVVQGAGDLVHIGLDAGRQVARAILDRLPRP